MAKIEKVKKQNKLKKIHDSNKLKIKPKWDEKTPFPHKIVKKALKNDFAIKIRKFLIESYKNEKIQLNSKENDLYSFWQSMDLSSFSLNPFVKKIIRCFSNKKLLKNLSKIVGTKLSKKVDFFVSLYTKNNFLLCHDDRLGSRKIAFIYYLTPTDWSDKDGGFLQLFDCDQDDAPSNIAKRIRPSFNSFAFFEVSNRSFHSVQEVLSDKQRLSITGWYHSRESVPVIYKNVKTLTKTTFFKTKIKERTLFSRYVNTFYQNKDVQKKIREELMKNKSVQLKLFLVNDKYEKLKRNFRATNFNWLHKGPYNISNYYYLNKEQTKHQSLQKLFSSNEFKTFIETLTEPNLNYSIYSVNKYVRGSYSLLNDLTRQKVGVDTIYNLMPNIQLAENKTNDRNFGGAIYYVNEKTELFSIDPEENCLSIIIRGSEQEKSFSRYVNSCSPKDYERIEFKQIWRNEE